MQNETRETQSLGHPARERYFSPRQVLLVVLFLCTALLVYCCYLITRPFLHAFAWAFALAVLGYPTHRWFGKFIRNTSVCAALTVVLMALLVIVPTALVGGTLVGQASATFESLQSGQAEEKLRAVIEQRPRLSRFWQSVGAQQALQELISQTATGVGKLTTKFVGGSVSATLSFLIALFLLFYFLRDRDAVMGFVRSILPISQREASQVFNRVSDTVHASIYGTLAVAVIQGALGGLMFWWLGIAAPLLWGVIMALLAIIPVLGAFVIWIPAAVFLAIQGHWIKAIILTAWGSVVIGLIDNLLFPVLVGKRLRLHTVPVFIAIVGGLMVFGASGLVLGPVILALTDATLDLWRSRMARRHTPSIETSQVASSARPADDTQVTEPCAVPP
jgi:predicted PurR-regulated permease PerM